MANTPQPHTESAKPPQPHRGEEARDRPPTEEDIRRLSEERAAEARKIFDENEKDADDDLPLTTQTDQLRRSMEMERVGPTAWMNEQERRIRERQGDPPIEPRQVHGVAPAQRPR